MVRVRSLPLDPSSPTDLPSGIHGSKTAAVGFLPKLSLEGSLGGLSPPGVLGRMVGRFAVERGWNHERMRRR